MAPISLNSNKSPPFLCCWISRVFWVSCCHYISRPWVSGGPGMAGMTALKTADGPVAGVGCRSSGRRVLAQSRTSSQSRAGVEAHHRRQGGSGSPMRAVVSHAVGGSTRSAEQRWPLGREIERVQRDRRTPAQRAHPLHTLHSVTIITIWSLSCV